MAGGPHRRQYEQMFREPLRVLLVDDSRIFIDSAWAVLVKLGMSVIGATSSAESALVLADQLQPDLVLMDVVMPGLNGFDATRLLKRTPNPPRVIIVSLGDSEIGRAAAKDAHADGFLAKSLFVERLPELIAELFGDDALARR